MFPKTLIDSAIEGVLKTMRKEFSKFKQKKRGAK